MITWKYTDNRREIVQKYTDGVTGESCIADREDILEWVAQGGVIEEPDSGQPEA